MMARWSMGLFLLVLAGCSWPYDVERPFDPTPECGDNYLTPDEGCDDGNTIQEACDYGSTTCTVCGPECTEIEGVTSYCGDGSRDETYEECDDGNTVTEPCPNFTEACTVCSENCEEVPGLFCGDGMISPEIGEECDDMNDVIEACDHNAGSCQVCGPNCLFTAGLERSCGDGNLDADYELCDDGNTSNLDGCVEGCVEAACGDGYHRQDLNVGEPGHEGCDDGNTVQELCDYGEVSCTVCDAACQLAPGATSFCGDQSIDTANGEVCDDGNQVVELCDYGDGACEVCGPDCGLTAGVLQFCGDSMVQGNFEECDDGNSITEPCSDPNQSCQVCGASCVWVPGAYCGDGDVTVAIGEECDDANDEIEACDHNAGPCEVCGLNCLLTAGIERSCGDGNLDVDYEACDDGNTITEPCSTFTEACTVCSASCEEVPGIYCGDGIVSPEIGEECDDGNSNDDLNGCSALCLNNAQCGNGILEDVFETCDDGYVDGCGECNATCSGPGGGYGEGTEFFCGDGDVCLAFEACDDGNDLDSDGCLSTCESPACGDGQLRLGLNPGEVGYEECDDGTVFDEGNGCAANCLRNDVCGDMVVQELFEICDDGYSDACGSCNADCSGPGTDPVCGNGIHCPEFEACDDGNSITEVCEYGVSSCQTCTATCEEGDGIFTFCGDGVVQPLYEECDDGDANTIFCSGALPCTVCTPACRILSWEAGGGGGGGGACDGDPQVMYYRDIDSDGFGDPDDSLECAFQPPFYVTNDLDCDPSDFLINPSQTEICNGTDDNCDLAIDEGIKGTGSSCAVASCLAVLEDRLPTNSELVWLVRDGEDPRQVFCDFGQVGGGWAHRQNLTITNTTDSAWIQQPVAFIVNTQALIAGDKLQSLGQDLRIFTLDDGLLDYWYGDPVGTTSTEVWVTVAALEPGASMELVLAYGNPDADSRSQTLFADRFRTDTSNFYTLASDPGTNSTFTWSASDQGRYVADGWNDYFWMVNPASIEPSTSFYIETRGYWVADEEDGDDGLGPAFSTQAGEYYAGIVSDGYDGHAFSTKSEAVIRYAAVPELLEQAEYVLDAGNLMETSAGLRVGLWVRDSEVELFVDGVSLGTASWSGGGMHSIGLASIANGPCEFDYLWVSRDRPSDAFDPEALVSVGDTALGVEQSF